MADKNITSDIITLSVPAQLENLHMIRYVVLHAAMQFGFSSEDAAKVEMDDDEACTNVILHGYGDQAKKEPYPPLFLNILFDKEKLIIEIADQEHAGAGSCAHDALPCSVPSSPISTP